MTEEGKYIYSIIKEAQDRKFGSIGINNREVSLIRYKDISAVVSGTPVINFDRLDKKELTRYVATHQKVNEEVMKDYDVVPTAFGIIAPSASEVSRILEKAYLQFKTALKNITGKVEFAVQVWWDQKKLLEELVNINPEIQRLKQEASSKGGILGMPIKLKLGKLIQKEIETQRQTFINNNNIRADLQSLSYDSTLNKLIDDDMIANFSFLIEKVREPELDRKMQELGKKYEGKLKFKYIGPMSPYSFANINLGLGDFELIDEARRTLGLGEEASFGEIRQAYYALSHQYHPDRPRGNEEEMKKITQAYAALENYCQSCDEIAPTPKFGVGVKGKVESQKYSFKKEDVENSLIIK